MSELKEYVVTLHRQEDLEEFYLDMETLRATPYNCMPERTVDVANRRSISRNTHYWMTEEEAAVLRQDPRVKAAELTPKELGMHVRPFWIQASNNWNKSDTTAANQSGTIAISEEGRNVDVIIVNGHFNPAHPEFAMNPDGTGGSRVVQLDWHNLTPAAAELNDDIVPEFLTKPYSYTPYTGGAGESDNNHGAHVAGTVAGVTQGWARKANIYNINPYGSNTNSINVLVLLDYIRAFHTTKPINPSTGKKNPTICNHSWGYSWVFNLSTSPVLSVRFRGSTIDGPFTESQLRSYGIYVEDGVLYAPATYAALDADMEDAITEGIIMVGAAGNDSTKMDVPGGQDYGNYFTLNAGSAYYNRGSSPSSAPGVICVGSVGMLATEYKADYSNSGPRIDVWAPGTMIISSTNSGGISDPRGNGFLNKYFGTSMASPQVCGVLACVLETYPDLTPTEALAYIKKYAKPNQLTDTGGGLDDYRSLQGAPNLYLTYNKERPTQGKVFPKLNYKLRPTTGAVYPRPRKG